MSIDDEIAEKQTQLEMFWRTDDPATVLELIDMTRGDGARSVRACLVEIAAFARSGIEAIDRQAARRDDQALSFVCPCPECQAPAGEEKG